MALVEKNIDEFFMRLALEESTKARRIGEVPVGAVIVNSEGEVISTGFNLRESTKDPTAHAEILAIRRACDVLGTWRLTDCSLYVTLEPCVMCMGAVVSSRIKRLVFGVPDPKAGAVVSKYSIGVDKKLNHTVEVESGILSSECKTILQGFFAALRKIKN